MEKILVLDFGGQYCRLIARRVRECRVYSEVLPHTAALPSIKESGYSGIILTGGPDSVYEKGSAACDPGLFSLGIPVLGICYGAHLMARALGGDVAAAENGEYGNTPVTFAPGPLDGPNPGKSGIFSGLPDESVCWMSHRDCITRLPAGFRATAHTAATRVAAAEDAERRLYAMQFHPEVTHTQGGFQMLRSFLFGVCGCSGSWHMSSFIDSAVAAVREKAGGDGVLLGISGGVDSAVAAVLINRAVGDRLSCVFVDHGLLRKGEARQVRQVLEGSFSIRLIVADSRELFLNALKGVTDPEAKRRIIGAEFAHVFSQEAEKLGGGALWLAQGTIYPDVIESGAGSAAVIKSHHNVGGLPKDINFKGVIEPLRSLFKDEVRETGELLGLPKSLVWRQPFPGPGLAVRVIGEVTSERLRIARECDAIFCEELEKENIAASQYFAVLTGGRSVGVMGDSRTYEEAVALRAVSTDDFMTAEWVELPPSLLRRIAGRLCSEVRNVNRVVYDVTSKPPATIEWE